LSEEKDPNSKELDYPPEIVSTLTPEEVEKLKKSVPLAPAGLEIEGTVRNFSDLLGAMMAFFEKEAIAVLDRTFLRENEIPVFTGMIQLASHGYGGGGALDFSMPEVAERTYNELHARRSLNGDSSERFERVMTAWQRLTVLREEQRLRDAKENQMVGLK
jgi:hypothetical protein